MAAYSYEESCLTPPPNCGVNSATKADCNVPTAPCCSHEGYCGATVECNGGCQVDYSFNKTVRKALRELVNVRVTLSTL